MIFVEGRQQCSLNILRVIKILCLTPGPRGLIRIVRTFTPDQGPTRPRRAALFETFATSARSHIVVFSSSFLYAVLTESDTRRRYHRRRTERRLLSSESLVGKTLEKTSGGLTVWLTGHLSPCTRIVYPYPSLINYDLPLHLTVLYSSGFLTDSRMAPAQGRRRIHALIVSLVHGFDTSQCQHDPELIFTTPYIVTILHHRL